MWPKLTLIGVLLLATAALAAEMMKSSPLMNEDRARAMEKRMAEMKPDTLLASIKRGAVLFNDTKLGGNPTGLSCASCHPRGRTTGGAAEMEWKGETMRLRIPTLVGAAATFPKPIGPMRVVSPVSGQNNMCIISFLKGRPLDLNSREATDLEAYVYSWSNGKRIEMGGKMKKRPQGGM